MRFTWAGMQRVVGWAVSVALSLNVGCELNRDVVATTIPRPDVDGGAGQGGTVIVRPYPSYGGSPGGGVGGFVDTSGGTDSYSGGEASGSGGAESYAGDAGMGAAGQDAGPRDCSSVYPAVSLSGPSAARAVCSAALARDRMAYALCACGDLNVSGVVTTNAFDSSEPEATLNAGAAVGINGTLQDSNYASIQGSFSIAGTSRLTLLGLEVAGDLKLAAPAVSSGPVRVGRDAWFAESVSVLTETYIDRDLHLARGAVVNGLLAEHVGGRTYRDFTEFTPPCRCGSDATFDLQKNIEQARTENDNASIALSIDALSAPSEAIELDLPCGRYFLSSVRGTRPIRIRVQGRVALFVAGDVTGIESVQLAAGGELDWFVGGRLDLRAAERLGDPMRAARLRIYVAGASEISYPASRVAANLHAPASDVTITGVGDVYGSIYARDISSPNALTVNYDRAIVALADACSPQTSEACTGCGECGAGLTCRSDTAGANSGAEAGPESGLCTSCAKDSDCCSPMVCTNGLCEPLLTEP